MDAADTAARLLADVSTVRERSRSRSVSRTTDEQGPRINQAVRIGMIKAGLTQLAASSTILNNQIQATHRAATVALRTNVLKAKSTQDVENNLMYLEGTIEAIWFASQQLASSAEALRGVIP